MGKHSSKRGEKMWKQTVDWDFGASKRGKLLKEDWCLAIRKVGATWVSMNDNDIPILEIQPLRNDGGATSMGVG
ncbi:hypothetical protein QJS10_CPA08g00964 [Acorus calamus]|uniref:Uncharacterized protein n=1 Tax=Acorus calamus TaxID=4465 RepID=A0AAV9EBQ2_ACOCL|nr:hypothetical protein QJS10_CPA08g00964 [Acorus calamus]